MGRQSAVVLCLYASAYVSCVMEVCCICVRVCLSVCVHRIYAVAGSRVRIPTVKAWMPVRRVYRSANRRGTGKWIAPGPAHAR
jgi:hypothetical protein